MIVASGTQVLQNINDEPGLTLTYLTSRSYWVAYAFKWGKMLQSHLMGKTCSEGLD